MAKFDIYYNKKTRHPSIEIEMDENDAWINISITHSPNKNKMSQYVQFDINPNPLERNDRNSKSYFKKHLRKDKKGVRGKKFKNYHLEKSDRNKIDKFLKNKKR